LSFVFGVTKAKFRRYQKENLFLTTSTSSFDPYQRWTWESRADSQRRENGVVSGCDVGWWRGGKVRCYGATSAKEIRIRYSYLWCLCVSSPSEASFCFICVVVHLSVSNFFLRRDFVYKTKITILQ